MTKCCSKCSRNLELSDFNKVKRKGITHLKAACKTCQSTYEAKYRTSHLEEMRQKQHKWFENNKEKQYDRVRNFKLNNKQTLRNRNKERLKSDVNYRISRNLRTRLWCALKRKRSEISAVRDLGCSLEEFKVYLSSLFKDEMTWDNYGKWQIDHIVPISKFDLSDKEQLLKACNYKNLQPMWASENASKRNKYIGSYRNKLYAADAEKE